MTAYIAMVEKVDAAGLLGAQGAEDPGHLQAVQEDSRIRPVHNKLEI